MLEELKLLRINLQLFAEDPEGNDDSDTDASGGDDTQVTDDGLPKTQEDLDKIIEKRLERERKKYAKVTNTQQTQQKTEEPPQSNPDLENINRELLTARAQLEAFRNGVKAEVVEDAVYLALREAEKDGDADVEDIKEALKTVLKRHPEWKSDSKQGGGFKVGATGGTSQNSPSDDALAEIFGNKK